MSKILEALLKLDVTNDNHWTADGLPRLDTVKMLAADQTLTRDSVTAEAPGFTRATAVGYTVPEVNENKPPVVQSPEVNVQPPVVQDQQPPVTEVSKTDSEVTTSVETTSDELKAALDAQVEIVAKLRKAKVEADAAFEAGIAEEDKLRIAYEESLPANHETSAIQGYLESRRKVLEARAARQQLIKESGINLKELATNLKAPIDSVRKRR